MTSWDKECGSSRNPSAACDYPFKLVSDHADLGLVQVIEEPESGRHFSGVNARMVVTSITAHGGPGTWTPSQARGSLEALFANMTESAAFLSLLLETDAEKVSPTEWLVSERLRGGLHHFEPR